MNELTSPPSSTSSHALSSDGSAVPLHWVEDLFKRLTAIVGSSMFTVVYAGADPQIVKEQWAEALASFSSDEVKRGISATRTRRFPPNLPEFLHLCRPSLDPETAWIEAEQGMALQVKGEGEGFAWSHPAVYWAARQLSFELRSGTFAQCRKRWESVLAAEFAKCAWDAVPDPMQRAIAPPAVQTSFDPVLAQAAREKLRQVRERMTGYATQAEQGAALERAEAQALQQLQGEGA